MGNLVKRIPVSKKYSNKSIKSEGKIPVIDQTKNDVIGYHNNNDYVIANENNPVITFANHTCNLRLMTNNFSTIQNVPFVAKDLPVFWIYFRSLDLQKFEEYKGHIPEFLSKKLLCQIN